MSRVCFQDLRAINNMIKMGEKKTFSGKRLLEVDRDDEEPDSPAKRACDVYRMRRLQNLTSDRQEANGSA
jgi:hypothetical protein